MRTYILFLLFSLLSIHQKIQAQSAYDKLLENYLKLTYKTAEARFKNKGICASRISQFIKKPEDIKKLSTKRKEFIIANLGAESHQYPYGLIQATFSVQGNLKPADLYKQKSPYEMMLSLHLLLSSGQKHPAESFKSALWYAPLETKENCFYKLKSTAHQNACEKWDALFTELETQPITAIQ